MTRKTPMALLLMILAGCSTSASIDSQLGQNGQPETRTQLAAHAATAQFPRDAKASDDLSIGAVADGDAIKIHNYSDRPLRDVNVWVNGAFVRQVASIAPMSIVTIRRSEFYDATGRTLAGQQTTVTRVQIQAGDTLYNVQGPIREK